MHMLVTIRVSMSAHPLFMPTMSHKFALPSVQILTIQIYRTTVVINVPFNVQLAATLKCALNAPPVITCIQANA
jgi:hypothetical protein